MRELKEKLLKLISQGSVDFNELIRLLKSNEEDKNTVSLALRQLEIEGKLYCLNNGKYIMFPSNRRFCIGKVNIVDGEVEFEEYPDVVLGNEDKSLLRDKDIVVLRLTNKGFNNAQFAVLDKVLSRKPVMETFLVQKKGEDLVIFNPAYGYGKLPNDVVAEVDDMVVFNVVYDEHFNIKNYEPVENVGNQFEENAHIKELIVKEGNKISFPEDVELEASSKDLRVNVDGRVNYASKRVLSLSDGNTDIVDNAFHIEVNQDGTSKLFVHMADVTEYFDLDSPLFNEAIERGTSFVGSGYDVPMLPRKFSHDTCSLNPNVPKYTITIEINVDKNGKVGTYKINRGVIISRINMTYETADMTLKTHSEPQYIKCLGILEDLAVFSSKRDKLKREKDVLNVQLKDVVPIRDESNEISRIDRKEKTLTQRIKENCIECANECLANYFSQVNVSIINRVQDDPEPAELKKLVDILISLGIRVPRNLNTLEPQAIRSILNSLAVQDSNEVITRLINNVLSEEEYSVGKFHHFGKALPNYSNFTSPISKATDMMNQYQIKYIMDKKPFVSIELLQKVAARARYKEKIAKKIDSELNKMYMCQYMQLFIGCVFEAVITNININGMEVVLNNGITGYITFQNMEDDFYRFFPDNNLISSKRGRMSYRIGDKIYVRLDKSDMETRRIDFAMGPQITKDDMLSSSKGKSK